MPLLPIVQYLNRALAHHMLHALDLEHLPLTDDTEAQQWCAHDETLVRAAMLHAVGREEFVKMVHWLSDVQGEHFHASTMLFTLATDDSVFKRSEMQALMLQSSEYLEKAKVAPGWAETKDRLEYEFHLNEKLQLVVEFGSNAFDQYVERNVELSNHEFFADDPEKKLASLMAPLFNKMGFSPANPSPSPQDLREGFQVTREILSLFHAVADICAEQDEGGAKAAVYRASATGWLTFVSPHWPQDFKAIVLQGALSQQQLLDTITVLDFSRHAGAFKLIGYGFDPITTFPLCEELLELWGDVAGSVQVLEKQMLFIEEYSKRGWSWETSGTVSSGPIARMLGMGESLWAHFKRLGLVDEDSMRGCYEQAMATGWCSDDGTGRARERGARVATRTACRKRCRKRRAA